MSGKIFISYRRDDSRYQARMIYEAFLRRMPRENVFMDIDTIPLGVNFVKVLEGWVEQCEVLLVLMGAGWANYKVADFLDVLHAAKETVTISYADRSFDYDVAQLPAAQSRFQELCNQAVR